MLQYESDGTFHAIGVHYYGGLINRATAIGHVGNDIMGFQTALQMATGSDVSVPECRVIVGKVDQLKWILVQKQPANV